LADLQDDLDAAQLDLADLEADRAAMEAEMAALEAERDHLVDLRGRLVVAIDDLLDFREVLLDFNDEIIVFMNNMDTTSYAYDREATYSWEHPTGIFHHVKVDVSTFTLPWLKVEKKKRWYGGKMGVYLQNGTGTITVNVWRYDQWGNSWSEFANGLPIWRYHYGKYYDDEEAEMFDPRDPADAIAHAIHSQSVCQYTYNALPRIVSVR
jgi:hypothetical protein